MIILLTDDQGYGDFSCHGNPVLQTPAMDKLYEESVRFSNFHVTPLCTPTRSQLITGMDAMHNKASTVGKGRSLMRRDLTTLPEVFASNGYQTGIFGKWHLGDTYPDRPMDRGFHKSVWIKGWGLRSEMEFDNDYYETRYLDSLETKFSDKYCTDLWFDKGMEWMSQMNIKGKPFFTYLALNTPHGPFDSPKKNYEKYRGLVDDDKTASFLGMVENIDENIARLDRWLEKEGLKDNTIVILMTDNGTALGEEVYNAGMRGKKGSNYDGGHRAACFIRWPKNFSPRTINYASQIQDIFPTLTDLLSLKTDLDYTLDGQSLMPVINHPDSTFHDRMFVVQYAGLDDPKKYYSAVIWDSWRLVGKDELYDISIDPGQEKNIAEAHPEVHKKMHDFYENWWSGVEPRLNEYIPLVVGSKENPVILSSDMWIGRSVNTQWKVAQAEGTPRGGIFQIAVERSGNYKMELSRWPFHLQRDLTKAGPEKSIAHTDFNPGKGLPIHYGCISLNEDNKPFVISKSPGANNISLELMLEEGEHKLRSWFMDEQGTDLCGAYYVRVTRVD